MNSHLLSDEQIADRVAARMSCGDIVVLDDKGDVLATLNDGDKPGTYTGIISHGGVVDLALLYGKYPLYVNMATRRVHVGDTLTITIAMAAK